MVIYMTTPILPHNHGDIHNVLEAMPSKVYLSQIWPVPSNSFVTVHVFRSSWLLCHSEECVLNYLCCCRHECSRCLPSPDAVLKDAGLITGNRHGKEVHYHIASTTQAALLHHFVDSYLHTSCPGEFDSQGISHSQTEHFQHESCSCGCSHSDN